MAIDWGYETNHQSFCWLGHDIPSKIAYDFLKKILYILHCKLSQMWKIDPFIRPFSEREAIGIMVGKGNHRK
jgi:hypothetical protein